MSGERYNRCTNCSQRVDRYTGYRLAKFVLPNRTDNLLSPACFYCVEPACTPFHATWVKTVEAVERPKPKKDKPETLQEKQAKKEAVDA